MSGHDHSHQVHLHSGHDHGPGEHDRRDHTHHAAAQRPTLSLLRLSAAERLAGAGVLITALWLAVLWAVVFGASEPGASSQTLAPDLGGPPPLIFAGGMVFLTLLVLGLVYDWRKGVFRWR